MSRSRRHRPFTSITAASSEKDDKSRANRRLRRRLRRLVLDETNDKLDTRPHDGGWTFAKDGKAMFDLRMHPGLMRK